MNNFITGIQYSLAGFNLIFKPGMKRFVFIPFLINLMLFLALFFVAKHYVFALTTLLANYLPTWLLWLAYLFWLLFFLSFFLILLYTFLTLANLIAAPFNSLLAEKVEFYLTGKKLNADGFLENIKDVPRLLARQLAIIAYYLPRAFLLFILFFIPVIQTIAPFLWFLFNAWLMSLTFMDYPTDIHRIPIKKVIATLKLNKSLYLGFGVTVLLISMIPLLNFFIMPAAVAGATKLWVEKSKLFFQ